MFIAILLAAASLTGKENTVSVADARDGWIVLFDGESLLGWAPDAAGKWRVADGTLLFDGPEPSLLRTTIPFVDFTLKFDFRAADVDRAGGVFLRMGEANPNDTGYLLRRGRDVAPVIQPDGPAPSSGVWHTSEIELSGDHFTVKLDGRKVGEGKDARSKAGYIGLEGRAGSRIEYRNLKLKLMNPARLFNGSELKGWKVVNAPPSKPGALQKIIKLPGAKPNESRWSVVNGLIHGERGPGQLETGPVYDNFLLQLDYRVIAKKKNEQARTAVYVRGDPGQLASGYTIAAGELVGLKEPRKLVPDSQGFVTETIAAQDRHFEIWIDGVPVTGYTDPRADSPSARTGSRSLPGSIALEAPPHDGQADFGNINVVAIPKMLGGDMAAKAAPPPPLPSVTQTPLSTAPAAAPPPLGPAADPRLQQQQAKEEAKQARISQLTKESLESSDPQKQVNLNKEILELDPSNIVALQNFKEAKGKIEAAAAQQQKQSEEKSKQVEQQTSKEAQASDALTKGEAAIVAGDLMAARSYLSTADRLMPGNPRVQQLRSQIDNKFSFGQRVRWLATGAGALAVFAAIGLWWRSRGQKIPYLEVIDGLDKGKRFDLTQDVIHIGAVPQDGGAKNEVVVRDVERMVSRFHCEIHNQKGKFYLVDCNSSNGTSLDGKRVAAGKPIRLKNGSTVLLGRACALRLGFEKQKQG